MSHYNISFVGAGKVTEALCQEFHQIGHVIRTIVSTGRQNGERLAELSGAKWSSSPVFGNGNDIIIAAVPDNKLVQVLEAIKCSGDTIVAHTAASFGLEVFPDTIIKRGLFYPLQTFSTGRKANLNEIPVFIEASDEETDSVLKDIASSVGCKIYETDAERRRMLHVAAVFVSNFTNHMLTSGKEISSVAGFSFDILIPLIRETVSKAIENGPEKSQTGPAIRHDLNTLEKHKELLSFSPEMRRMYEEVSKSIMDYYKDLK
jgi:predicted short-subunit dehydrogenase-like oxidoreductase (DUF2520 family)